jgi:copper transport protein
VRVRAQARRRWLIVFIVFAAVAFALEAAMRGERSGLTLLSSQYGLTLAVRAGLLTGLVVVWRARGETGWAGALMCGLLLLTQSANSHSAAEAGGLPVLADWLHLTFAAIWLGGVGQLALIDAPLSLRSGDSAARSDFGALIRRFSPWAMFCVLGLALTGLAQSAIFIENIEALWTTAYGRALSLKVALFAVLLILGAVHQFALAPRLREIRKRAASAADSPNAMRAMRAFRASISAEAAVACGALMAAGLLISLPPSRDVVPDTTIIANIQTRVIGDITLTLGLSPAEAGPNQFVLRVATPPNAPAEEAVLRIDHETINTGVTEIVLAPYAQPLFAARSSALALQGNWKIEVVVRRANLPDTRAEFEVAVEK